MKGTITMSNREANRVAVLEQLDHKEIKQRQAAEVLGLSIRQVRRVLKRYRREGMFGLVHGNRNRASNRKIPSSVKRKVETIVKDKYFDFGPTLVSEKLEENHDIKMSRETIRRIMIEMGLWETSRRKMARVHPMRERRNCEGELVQIDGSPHHWLEDRGPYCDLLLYVDDATSKLKWAELFLGETTKAYFKSSKGYFEKYGKPLACYSDKNSIFRINTKKGGSSSTADSNGLTQFGRAMKELDVKLICAHSAQAKGRVERANLTLQDRLVKELRLQGISSIEKANLFLPSFIAKFNSKFSVQAKEKVDVHRPLLPTDDLDRILCFKHTRILSKNLTCQYKNRLYQVRTKKSAYVMRHAPVLIRESLEEEVSIEYKGKNLDYSILEEQPKTDVVDSKQLNLAVDRIKQNRTPWKPPENHPWRRPIKSVKHY